LGIAIGLDGRVEPLGSTSWLSRDGPTVVVVAASAAAWRGLRPQYLPYQWDNYMNGGVVGIAWCLSIAASGLIAL